MAAAEAIKAHRAAFSKAGDPVSLAKLTVSLAMATGSLWGMPLIPQGHSLNRSFGQLFA